MKKFKYITEFLVVFLMCVDIIISISKYGFDLNILSQTLTLLILASAFYENYDKDKLIKNLQKTENIGHFTV